MSKTMGNLVDRFNRRIDYLRISVTDRCNLRCVYCMPEAGITNLPHDGLLSFEEIAHVVKVAVSLGVNKVRLTGGEPLVRKELPVLIKFLAEIEGIEDISLTTNGILLKKYAAELKKAGLRRINVSLDTLNESRYRSITRFGNLKDVEEGIKKAIEAGLSPVKINVVLLGGINEEEIANFLGLTIEESVHIRFLELMPVANNDFCASENVVSCEEVINISRRFGSIEPASLYGHGPAKTFRFKHSLGTFGLISPISDKFCLGCNRLRLTSDGFLKPCLHSSAKVDVRSPLRKGAGEEEIARLIRLAVSIKPEEHSLDKNQIQFSEYLMCQIGG
jgi:cyclic pyranopterin phosphate synthase